MAANYLKTFTFIYAASKGEGDREIITFMDTSGKEIPYQHDFSRIGIVISFGYTLKRLEEKGFKFCDSMDLKKYFIKILKLPSESKWNRWEMAEKLGVEIDEYPRKEKWSGKSTCGVYHFIFRKLHSIDMNGWKRK